MKILFLHGWQSVPGGVKPTYLKNHGHTVFNPKLDDDNFETAVKTAQAEFDEHHPDVVVGSSRGGAVAININSGDAKLVLLCPAWKNWGAAKTVKAGTVILHSRADDVIPYSDSEELAKISGVKLIDVGNDHRLADAESLFTILRVVCNRPRVNVLGIDPASSKGLSIWDGVKAIEVEAKHASDWILSLKKPGQSTLICWDSPLAFDHTLGLSDRPIDKIVRSTVKQWIKQELVSEKSVSVLPFSGCSHWVISCEALGLPFSRSGNPPSTLAVTREQTLNDGVWLLESHPVVALALWWIESDQKDPFPKYKQDKAVCRLIAETLGFEELLKCSSLNDDLLDAYVAYRQAEMFLQGKSLWIGDTCTGGYVLPNIAEERWRWGTSVKQLIAKMKNKAR